MVPVADVVWFDSGQPAGTALRAALRTAHSRFPVARGSFDHVVGIVHLRDLAGAPHTTSVGELAAEPHVVPASKDLGALLRELREGRRSMAVVADEYGRTLGLVTVTSSLTTSRATRSTSTCPCSSTARFSRSAPATSAAS